jgi:hypothetical protein
MHPISRLRAAGLLAIALLTTVTSCSTIKTEFGSPVPFAQVDALQPGLTTRRQVLAQLGPPTALTPYGDGVAFLYEQLLLTEQQFGISLKDLPYVTPWLSSLFKAVIGQGKTQHDAATLFFDEAGILQDARSGSWPEIVGRGGALQFFGAVQPVVQAEAYLRSPLLMDWGFYMLDPLQQAQNQDYRAQVELKGTSVKSGQRSLELLEWNTR